MNSTGEQNASRPEQGRRRSMHIKLSPVSMIMIVLIVAGVWLLIQLMPVLLVLVSALIIVGTVNPLVQRLEARRVRRGVAIAIVFVSLFVLSQLIITMTLPSLLEQVAQLIKQEPVLRARAADFLEDSKITAPFAESLRNLHYDELAKSLANQALALSARIIEIFAYTISAVFLALYMMIDRDRLRGWLFALVPRLHHIRLSRIMMNLETIVGGYMRGQVFISSLMAAFVFVLLKAFSVQNALAIAMFGGAVDVLPYIGPILTIIPVVLSALPLGLGVTMVIFALMVAYEEFESRFLIPRVYGRTLRLPSAVILFSLLAGGTLYGVFGALLSLPVAAAALMLVKELRLVLPGEPEKLWSVTFRERDEQSEQEYKLRAEDLPAEQAAALAIEITRKHRGKKSTGHPEPGASDRSDKKS